MNGYMTVLRFDFVSPTRKDAPWGRTVGPKGVQKRIVDICGPGGRGGLAAGDRLRDVVERVAGVVADAANRRQGDDGNQREHHGGLDRRRAVLRHHATLNRRRESLHLKTPPDVDSPDRL